MYCLYLLPIISGSLGSFVSCSAHTTPQFGGKVALPLAIRQWIWKIEVKQLGLEGKVKIVIQKKTHSLKLPKCTVTSYLSWKGILHQLCDLGMNWEGRIHFPQTSQQEPTKKEGTNIPHKMWFLMHLDYFQYGQVWVKLSFWFRDKHLLVVPLYDTETGRALVTLRTLIPCLRAPFLWSVYLPKASSPNTIMLGTRVSTYEFWGYTNLQAVTSLH